MTTTYKKRITELIEQIPEELIGPLTPPTGAIKVPTQAFSDFIINKKLGDWAEDVIGRGIESSVPDYKAIHYGRSEDLIAGDPGFKSYYIEYIKELRSLGKRPDVLVYAGPAPSRKEIEGKSATALIPIASRAIAGIEVRSSQQALGGNRTSDDLSFTPKIEDIVNVYRWIQSHGVKHYFFQLIFGAVYAISFEKILELLVIGPKGGGFKLRKEQRNQFKITAYIPLSIGTKISTSFEDPDLSAFKRQLPTGRMLFGVSFSGGSVVFDRKKLCKLLTD